jgi:hypothetical protein
LTIGPHVFGEKPYTGFTRNPKGETTMRFMILRKADARTEADVMPSAELLAAMGQYIQEMAEADVLLSAEGLRASALGARVNFAGGKASITQGPFGVPASLLAGYCVIQVPSLQDAIRWVKRWPTLDGDGTVEIEIRQLFEAEDFGPALTAEQREAAQSLRSRAA